MSEKARRPVKVESFPEGEGADQIYYRTVFKRRNVDTKFSRYQAKKVPELRFHCRIEDEKIYAIFTGLQHNQTTIKLLLCERSRNAINGWFWTVPSR